MFRYQHLGPSPKELRPEQRLFPIPDKLGRQEKAFILLEDGAPMKPEERKPSFYGRTEEVVFAKSSSVADHGSRLLLVVHHDRAGVLLIVTGLLQRDGVSDAKNGPKKNQTIVVVITTYNIHGHLIRNDLLSGSEGEAAVVFEFRVLETVTPADGWPATDRLHFHFHGSGY